MAVRDLYPNLPGHLVVFKDGGLTMRENPVPAGNKSMLILGTALDGPINEPVAVDMANISKIFGEDYTEDVAGNSIPNGSTLVKYARQLYAAGFNDIRCMRVTGTQATATLTADTKEEVIITDMTPISFIANGNDEIKDYQIDFSSITTPINADETPIISDISCSYGGNISAVTVDSCYPDPATISIEANRVPARGAITYSGTVTRVSKTPKSVSESDGITIADTGDVDSAGDCIIEVIVPASQLADFYAFATIDGSLGTNNEDKHGIVPATSLIEFNTGTTDSLYGEVTLSVAGTAISLDPADGVVQSITKDSAGITIKYSEKGSAGTTTITGTEQVAFTFRHINIPAASAAETITGTIQVKDHYTPIELSPEKVPETTEDVTLVGASGVVCAKLSDGNGVITYDATNDKFIVDLTNIPTTINVTAFIVGTNMSVEYKHKEVIEYTEDITFQSIYGGSEYNKGKIVVEKITNDDGVEGRLISIYKPDSKKFSESEQPMQYSSFNYPTFGALKQAVEDMLVSPLNNVYEVVTNAEDVPLINLKVDPSAGVTQVQFTGGSDGINPTNDEMFVALSGQRNEEGYLEKEGAYQILENYNIDYIYVAGIYSDSTVSEKLSKMPQPFHYELALFCAVLTFRTSMVHGFIDVKPCVNTTLVGIQRWVEHVTNLPNLFYMRDLEGEIILDEDKKPMDIGWYTTCVVGPQPVCMSDTLGTYYGSPSLCYAALNASIASKSAPTNKMLPGCSKMRFRLSNKQMNAITANRMVCFKYKNQGSRNATTSPYVVDACTAGAPGTDYARLTTVKVVKEAVDNIREVCDPYIGEPNVVEQRNAMSAQISKRLSNLKERGTILWYSFEVIATDMQVLLGECTIALTLVAPQELRKITTVVGLKPTAA